MQQTEPVVYKDDVEKVAGLKTYPGPTARVLSSKHEIDDEPAEATEPYITDNRPEWQKIAARGGRSRPSRKG